MKKWVIAIDGPGGAGKSTIAKLLAKRLEYLYIDSGAMYRAVAWKALNQKINLSHSKELERLARMCKIRFGWDRSGKNLQTFLGKKNISEEIRSKKVDASVSLVAKIPEIRKVLVIQQRKLGKKGGVVMDGRDIGTVVFPNAKVKFFLDASSKERAKRRYDELVLKGAKVELKEIEAQLIRRDQIDSTRVSSPLKKAHDAIHIDSTKLSVKEVVEKMLKSILK